MQHGALPKTTYPIEPAASQMTIFLPAPLDPNYNSGQPQTLSKTEVTNEGHKKFPWNKLLKATIFYLIIIAIDFFLVNVVIPSYLRFLPDIDPSIFQALIQVIATLLGFSIVAVFYYLGKIDDLKTSYINSLFGARKSVEDILSIHEKFMKSVKDVLDTDNEKKIPEQVKETISKMYAEVKNSNKTRLEKLFIPIPEAIKTGYERWKQLKDASRMWSTYHYNPILHHYTLSLGSISKPSVFGVYQGLKMTWNIS